ncbi:mitochondrial 54S ribosomal protein YmL41 [Martiniozyma asiatica (nom. inval.)]|nr:mitochondrial 54S ribosomal protein YmL41 [Martiniozyma asiatica]
MQHISRRSIMMGRPKPMAPNRVPPFRFTKDGQELQRATLSKKIFQRYQDAMINDEENFTVGGKNIYFPWATIQLLRPNAKHTPYQAKFIVPKSFNKLDLRDYLYHIYGMRVLNITSALMPGTFTRNMPAPFGSRFRSAQVKKMTVDLEEPFVWPAESEEFKEHKNVTAELIKYRDDKMSHVNSDIAKPSAAFGGILDSNPIAMNFVSKSTKRKMKNLKQQQLDAQRKASLDKLILDNIKFE